MARNRYFNFFLYLIIVISILTNVLLYNKYVGLSKKSDIELQSLVQEIKQIKQEVLINSSALPEVTNKKAFINDIKSEEDGSYSLYVDYIDWFSGEDAIKAAVEDNDSEAASLNNGFYIRNKVNENEKIKLNQDTSIYVLVGAMLEASEYRDFISSELEGRLFNISFVSGSILVLEEQYRP
jgi:hypothetical protein